MQAEGLAIQDAFAGAAGANDTARADSRDAEQKAMKMDDLFSGVWMIEEERDGVSDSGSSLAEVVLMLNFQEMCRFAAGAVPGNSLTNP